MFHYNLPDESWANTDPLQAAHNLDKVGWRSAEWSTLIGPDCPDPGLILVEPYYAGFHAKKGSIIGTIMP